MRGIEADAAYSHADLDWASGMALALHPAELGLDVNQPILYPLDQPVDWTELA